MRETLRSVASVPFFGADFAAALVGTKSSSEASSSSKFFLRPFVRDLRVLRVVCFLLTAFPDESLTADSSQSRHVLCIGCKGGFS